MSVVQNKLIVALDVETADEARGLVASLRGIAAMFKIGSQLFTAAGPDFIKEIIKAGEKIFLDLKFHDIPNTVAAAGVEATRLGVSMFNVHAVGGGAMMRRTADAVAECAASEGLTRPTILGVTVLTSSDDATLREIGVQEKADAMVARLAQLAMNSGLDGVVASAREVSLVRAVTKPEFIVVTPGVRPAGAARDDQARVMSPREAIAAGADYLVVGRPIIAASDPARAAKLIVDEMLSCAAGSRS
ncbi:MAG: orotidine-5-phosphate decarboxylase [Pyrinomonadaceae bacterium]|jgi:orotidine-5'-phosphate decarboxylase|nr:orotidine-5-phosphate decarboxylase [Pyrinomonadaceae bacterium]